MSTSSSVSSEAGQTLIGISAPSVETAPAVEIQSVSAATTSETQLTTYADASKHVDVVREPVTPDALWDGTNTLPSQDLKAVLSRSYLLDEFTWSSSDTPGSVLQFDNVDIIKTLLAIPQIATKVAWYYYFRCKAVRVTVRINSTPFHYGLLALSSTFNDTFTTHNATTTATNYQFYQNNCVLIDATESDAVDYVMPWCSQLQWYDVLHQSPSNIINFKMNVAVGLRMIGASVLPVRVSVFANFVDPEVAFPVIANPLPFSHRERVNKEAREKTKSGSVASDLRETFDTVFQKVNDYASIAGELGPLIALLDKPTSLAPVQHMVTLPGTSMPHTSGLDTAVKLAADPEASAAFSSGSLGDQISNPSIEQLVRSPAYIGYVDLTASSTPGQLMGSFPVWPFTIARDSAQPGIWTPGPAWWFSMPFRYWRGGVKFFFYAVCSTMASARVRVAWIPPGAPPNPFPDQASGDAISKVVEITGPTRFSLTVPYISDSLYKINPYSHFKFATASTANSEEYYLGRLALYVTTPVVAPITTVTPQVRILVFSSMAEDAQYSNYSSPMFTESGVDGEVTLMYTQPEELEVTPHCSLVKVFSEPFEPIVSSFATTEFGLATSEQYHDAVSLAKRYSVGSLRPTTANSTIYDFFYSSLFLQPNTTGKVRNQQWMTACHTNFRGSIRWKVFWYDASSLAVPQVAGSCSSQMSSNLLENYPTFVTSRDPNSKFIEFEVPYNLHVPWMYRYQNWEGLAARASLPTTAASVLTEVGIQCVSVGDDFGMGIMEACPLIATMNSQVAEATVDPTTSGATHGNKSWGSGPRGPGGLISASSFVPPTRR